MADNYLGISLSHDASVSLHDTSGKLIFALQEERISRVKNHYGIPRASLHSLLEFCKADYLKVVIGSHNELDFSGASRFLALLDNNPSMKEGTLTDKSFYIYPGFKQPVSTNPPKFLIERKLLQLISQTAPKIECDFIWENHHDSHLGCAIAEASGVPHLLVSLDGAGDGESGAISVGSRNLQMQNLARVSELDSLGLLYSAVTARYNFMPTRHEGKITGLAAFGDDQKIVNLFDDFINVASGKPNLQYKKYQTESKYTKILKKILVLRDTTEPTSMRDFVHNVALLCRKYPDLAFGIQESLEKSVVEIISFWRDQTHLKHLSLSGGVFSNVKLNQRITEISGIKTVKVFPNMGDGGISAGGVWSYLNRNGQLSQDDLYSDMYLAPPINPLTEIGLAMGDPMLNVQELNSSELLGLAAQEVASNKLVAVHWGEMEFGPRALGNRSLILDPRNAEIKISANKRLRRTEFMPFAPIVTLEYFDTYFETNNESLQPFFYMTMTCNVREMYRSQIPAVTHIDGTARPQIVSSRSNPKIYELLHSYGKLTGLYVLVNTSLNIHEEPINYSLENSLSALKRDAFDVLYFENWRIALKN